MTSEYVHHGDVAGQTRQSLENVRAIVEAAGATFDDAMMVRVHLSDRGDFNRMNQAYGAFLTAHSPVGVLPSRTTVFTGLPHEAMLVEIDAFATMY